MAEELGRDQSSAEQEYARHCQRSHRRPNRAAAGSAAILDAVGTTYLVLSHGYFCRLLVFDPRDSEVSEGQPRIETREKQAWIFPGGDASLHPLWFGGAGVFKAKRGNIRS
jgi:hypothetical protein